MSFIQRGHNLVAAALLAGAAPARAAEPPDVAKLRSGMGFLETAVYTQEEDLDLLALFAGLRVADVVDGMDKAGLHGVGLMDPAIGPLWKETETFAHRFVGIAVTARYVPTNKPFPARMTPQEYDQWEREWYRTLSPEPFVPLIRPGTALVIEENGQIDVGSIGSNNIMSWKLRGCVGVVSSSSARDTDEIAIERVPLYFKHPGRGIRPGRNEIESVNRPVVCGGVTVIPGDVVVADGDGVVVVPRGSAGTVARLAREVLEGDKLGRRALYERLGLPPDRSVE